MIRYALKLHPDSRCAAATRIDVEVARARAGHFLFSYFVTGTSAQLRIPHAMSATRTDKLWQATCFEAFIRNPADAAYYEFNFGPSTQWAAYRFDSYREGMRDAPGVSAPRIEVQMSSAAFTLHAALEWNGDLPNGPACRLGLAAIIEETNGQKSYWALSHPPGKPDFHHADCFAHEFV